MTLIDIDLLKWETAEYDFGGVKHYTRIATAESIEAMPKVEAEPVRWTRFVDVHDNAIMCLACGTMLKGGNKELLNYCPHCGAKNGADDA